ncbi:(2Fe-2S) ferredoxin domain-containing protein [Lutispora saccharofermentans]|uniref:(2Fe-2S) ferredoxin domain-containing protein n=1 Tax=Lutispora saccharofermentans TaxID=3024236 RepID=A0ABT1NHV9_9FIRM|nr:(2Fe-2S) ferredoxin domain-containing protein [Lutispora saccharofermentans]MCQ1530862.1 (2Fe-2S) ferredoxin domain-containing protein [Lutispora saccharofermentans]
MIEISVCIGSSCHIKGSYKVIKSLQELIARYSMDDQVDLKASFCLGHCADGVVIKVGDRYINSVNPQNVESFFRTFILESE